MYSKEKDTMIYIIIILESSLLVLMGCTTSTDGKEPIKSRITYVK